MAQVPCQSPVLNLMEKFMGDMENLELIPVPTPGESGSPGTGVLFSRDAFIVPLIV